MSSVLQDVSDFRGGLQLDNAEGAYPWPYSKLVTSVVDCI